MPDGVGEVGLGAGYHVASKVINAGLWFTDGARQIATNALWAGKAVTVYALTQGIPQAAAVYFACTETGNFTSWGANEDAYRQQTGLWRASKLHANISSLTDGEPPDGEYYGWYIQDGCKYKAGEEYEACNKTAARVQCQAFSPAEQAGFGLGAAGATALFGETVLICYLAKKVQNLKRQVAELGKQSANDIDLEMDRSHLYAVTNQEEEA